MNNKSRKNSVVELLCHPKWSSISVAVLSILLSMVVASVLLLLLGKNPLEAYAALLKGCGVLPKSSYGGGGGMLADFCTFLNLLAPMIIASLAFVIASKAGLFNIGIAGQMLCGAYLSYLLVGYSDMNAWLAKPLTILVSLAVGGILGAFVGFLKYRFNIHEVVSTILINHIIRYLVGFSINGWHANSMTRNSQPVSTAARLSWTGVSIFNQTCSIPLGIFIAVIFAFAVQYLLNRTVFGFEIKSIGMNNKCARYTGIRVGRGIVVAMAISGMLAGLAGACYYTGYLNNIVPNTLSSMGYDAIAVAVLGNISPVGCILASFLITIFQQGTNYMSSTVGVAKEIANLITGILLLFSACGGYFKYLARNYLDKAAEKAGKSGEQKEA